MTGQEPPIHPSESGDRPRSPSLERQGQFIQDQIDKLERKGKAVSPAIKRLLSGLGLSEIQWLVDNFGIKDPVALFAYPIGSRIKYAMGLPIDETETPDSRPEWARRLDIIVEQWLGESCSTHATQNRLRDLIDELQTKTQPNSEFQSETIDNAYSSAVQHLLRLFQDPEQSRELQLVKSHFRDLFGRGAR